MADPNDKLTRNQGGGDITQQFDIPGREPSGILNSGFGPTVGAGERGAIRVVVRKNGTPEFYAVAPGKDPERIVPTPQELAYVKEIIDAQQKANPPPKEPPQRAPQTPDEVRLDRAQADLAELNARKATAPEPTIARPRANAGLLDTGVSATEQVTPAQATYDRQVEADRRQAQIDLQQRLEAAEQAVIERGRLSIQRDQLTAQQAHQKVQDDLEKIRIEVQREANAIQARGQDLGAETARRGQDISLQASREDNVVSRRGQDISSGVSTRGQDLGYEQSLVGDTVQMANVMQNHAAPLWQIAQVDAATRGKWGDQIPAMPANAPGPMFGTDPAAFIAQAAQSARQQRPPPFRLPDDQLRMPG